MQKQSSKKAIKKPLPKSENSKRVIAQYAVANATIENSFTKTFKEFIHTFNLRGQS